MRGVHRSIRPLVCALALLAMVASPTLGCRAYRPAPVSFKRPQQYPNTAEVFGVLVGARAFDDPKEAREAFGGFDVRAAGLLPVQIVFENRGSVTLTINPAQTFLEDADENLWPVMEKNLAYERAARYAQTQQTFSSAAHKGFLGAAAGALVGAAVGVVAGGNVAASAGKGAAIGGAAGAVGGGAATEASGTARREVVQDLRQKDLENTPIPPGQLVYGFVFFPGEVVDARVLRLQVRELDRPAVLDTIELAL